MDRRSVVTISAAAVVSAGLVTAGITHARSDDQPALTAPNATAATSLVLTVTPHGGGATMVSLECDPTDGSHPHAAEACAALSAANGQIDKIAPKQGEMCPHIVNPVRSTARGTYRSTPITYDHTWNNACEMTRATGALFAF